jgi:hypothetical protein
MKWWTIKIGMATGTHKHFAQWHHHDANSYVRTDVHCQVG